MVILKYKKLIETKIKILAKGEEKLLVETADEVKHPANRRVEIRALN